MLLDVLPALYGSSYRVIPRILPIRQLSIDWRPHDNHGIAYEFDDISAILIQIGDHAFHVAIDAKGKLLVASGSLLSASLTKIGETADVCEDNDGLHGL